MKILFVGQINSKSMESSSPRAITSIAMLRGHSIASDIAENPDLVICYNWTRQARRDLSSAKRLHIPTVLVKSEPSIVTPQHDNPKVLNSFRKVIELGRPNSVPVIKYPQLWNVDFFDNTITRVEKAVAISSNKFSLVPGELYSLRAQSYSRFNEVDVFGPGWDRRRSRNLLKLAKELQIAIAGGSRKISLECVKSARAAPKNYLGLAENKLETLSRYKVSLVIENSAEYMSEKLIDSILAGTIPVYVGPSLQVFGIPDGLVVSVNADIDSIQSGIRRAMSMDHDDWRNLAKTWLATPTLPDSWDASTVMHSVIEVAELELLGAKLGA